MVRLAPKPAIVSAPACCCWPNAASASATTSAPWPAERAEALISDSPSFGASVTGASPALAKRMKREIGDTFGPAYAELAELLNDVRGWAKSTLPTYDDRKAFFEGIVNGEPDPIALLRAGDAQAVRDLIEAARRSAVPA